jgi:hypothetical protein
MIFHDYLTIELHTHTISEYQHSLDKERSRYIMQSSCGIVRVAIQTKDVTVKVGEGEKKNMFT